MGYHQLHSLEWLEQFHGTRKSKHVARTAGSVSRPRNHSDLSPGSSESSRTHEGVIELAKTEGRDSAKCLPRADPEPSLKGKDKFSGTHKGPLCRLRRPSTSGQTTPGMSRGIHVGHEHTDEHTRPWALYPYSENLYTSPPVIPSAFATRPM